MMVAAVEPVPQVFRVERTYRDFEGGTVRTDCVEFADRVDAQDYADCLYRSGCVSRAVCFDPHGRVYFNVQREQYDYAS